MTFESDSLVFLEGTGLYLRPLLPDDALGKYPGWLNDADVSRGNSHQIYPYTREQAAEFIKNLAGRRDQLVLAIVEKKAGEHIGNISLQNINFINRSAELAVLLGEKSVWGQGHGYEAARLLVFHGFEALNLRRIELGTPEFNIGMQKVAEKLGMKHEGVKRSAFFKNGRYFDIWLYGLLRDEANSERL